MTINKYGPEGRFAEGGSGINSRAVAGTMAMTATAVVTAAGTVGAARVGNN